MPKMKKRNTDFSKVTMKFDVPMLNALIKFTNCEYNTNVQLANLNNLIKQINIENYNYSPDIQSRIKMVKLLCEAIVENNIRELDLIKTYLVDKDSTMQDLLNEMDIQKNQLTKSECKYISNSINERLQFIYIYTVKDEIVDLFEKVDNSNFNSYYEVINELKIKMGQLIVKLRTADASNGLIRSFNFSGDQFAQLMDIIATKSKKPSTILQTGIRQLNAILSPGFQSTRLYVILGGTGKFKSGTLLNLADQIRRFNPQIIPFENGMRKTVLFITCENTIEETVVRIYDMYSDVNDDMTAKTTEEIIQTLRENGHFTFTDTYGIDIDLQFYANMEINTADIYGIINELADQGKQVICMILDYISRINSTADNYGDERIRLGNVAKELKSISQYFEIPVITAMQINREGNSIIDAAMRENKQDVAQFIGSASVGNCWAIIEESDWVALINPELQKSSGKLFLTFKRLKIRGKKDPFSVDYFNHPFVNEKNIRLDTDVDKEKPISIISLASDLHALKDEELEKISQSRPKISSMASSNKSTSVLSSISLPGMPN